MALRTVTEPPAEMATPGSFEDAQQGRRALRGALAGKLNCVEDVSLAVSPATTTDVTDPEIGPDSMLLPVPTNTLAAAEPNMLQSYVAPNTIRLTHTVNVAARTFRYAVLG